MSGLHAEKGLRFPAMRGAAETMRWNAGAAEVGCVLKRQKSKKGGEKNLELARIVPGSETSKEYLVAIAVILE